MYNNEINTEETVWKKRVFRTDTIENFESENNPDILYINQKLKKINKRKKYKEFFTTSDPLTNVYDAGSAHIFNSNTDSPDIPDNFNKKNNLENIIKKAVFNQTFSDTPVTEKKEKEKEKKSLLELFNTNELFKCKKQSKNKSIPCESCDQEEGFKGIEERMEEKKKKFNIYRFINPLKELFILLNNIIFYFPKIIHDSVDVASEKTVKLFYSIDGHKDPDNENTPETNNNIKNDSNIVKAIIYMLAMFPISIYICYNWMFITIYKDHDYCSDYEKQTASANNPDEILKCRPASDSIRYKITFDDFNPGISTILNFILDFSIQPLYWFDNIVLGNNKFPKLLEMLYFKIIIKLIILIFAITIVYAFDIYTVFNDLMLGGALYGNYNIINIFCITIISMYYMYYVYKDIKSQFTPELPDIKGVIDPTDVVGTIEKGKTLIEGLIEKGQKLATWTAIPLILIFMYIIKYVIRFILSIWNIGFSEVILTIFIWAHSMFGIAIYGGGIGKISSNMDNIDDFINIDLEKLKEDNPDYIEYSLFRKIIIFLASFLYNNLYYFVYLMMIVGSIISSLVNIKSPSLKMVLTILFFIQGVIMVLLMWANTIKKAIDHLPIHVNKYTINKPE